MKKNYGKKGFTIKKNLKKGTFIVSTWKDLHRFYPSRIEKPTSIIEIQNIIKEAISKNQKVKAIGSGHSFTPAAVPDDGAILISLEKMNKVIDIGEDFITVQAGCTLKKIVEYLKKRNKQLPACTGFGSFQAGAFSGTQLQ